MAIKERLDYALSPIFNVDIPSASIRAEISRMYEDGQIGFFTAAQDHVIERAYSWGSNIVEAGKRLWAGPPSPADGPQ